MPLIKSVLSPVTSSVLQSLYGSGGAPLPLWTPRFDGLTGYGQLYNAFVPSGNDWEVSVTVFSAATQKNPYSMPLSLGGEATALTIRHTDNDALDVYNGTTSIPKGNFPPGSHFIVSTNGGELNIGVSTETNIGTSLNKALAYDGQIQRIQLLDNYDTGRTLNPVNGRTVVELDGLTKYAEIPAWTATNGEIEFAFQLDTLKGSTQFVFDGRITGVGYAFIDGADVLQYNSMTNLLVDGVATASGALTILPDKIYKITADISTGFGFDVVFANNTFGQLSNGFMGYLNLTDTDNVNNVDPLTRNTRSYKLDKWNSLVDDLEPEFPELVVNGDFSSGTDDWVANSSAILTAESGQLKITNGGVGFGRATQGYSTTIGETYNVLGDGVLGTSSLIEFKSTNTSTGSGGSLGTQTITSNGSVNYTFIATATTTYLSMVLDSGLDVDGFIDNISVKQTTQGEFINTLSTDEVFRANRSIDINTCIRSKDEPTETQLTNSLGSVGAEEVINGTFDTDLSGWTQNAGGWTWVDGKARLDGDGLTQRLQQFSGLTVGKTYQVDFDADMTGAIQFVETNNTVIAVGVVGHVSAAYVATSTGFSFKRQSGTVSGTIDNVSVKETTVAIGELFNIANYEPKLPSSDSFFLGKGVSGAFTNGIDLVGSQISSLGSPVGSITMTGRENEIITASSGKQIQITTVVNSTTADYIKLGTTSDSNITSSIAFPNTPTIA